MKKAPLFFLMVIGTTTVWAQTAHVPAHEHEAPSVFNWLSITTTLIAITAFALAFKIYRNLARLMDSVTRRRVDIKIIQEEVAEIKSRVVQQLAVNNAPQIDRRELEDRLLQIEKRINAAEQASQKERAAKAKSAPVAASAVQRKFAKLPDLENGFSNEVLQDLQNGEQIYELEIDGERGTFGVSKDAAAQKFALSDYQYYLATGCMMTNQPVRNSRIVVSEPGIVTRSSQGWTIEKKAVISFN